MYIIHIVETRELIVVKNETVNDEITENYDEDENNEYDSEDSDSWITYEEEDDERSKFNTVKLPLPSIVMHIEIRSTFKSKIEYEYKIGFAYSLTKKIEHVLEKYINSDDDAKLVSLFFCNNQIYNIHDLNDPNIVRTLKLKIDLAPSLMKLHPIIDKIIKNTRNTQNEVQSIVTGVEVTRQAFQLQQHLNHYSPSNNTLIITYNPLQSCIFKNGWQRDITHPVHIYRTAYSADLSGFYNGFELESLYNGWMKQQSCTETVNNLNNEPDLLVALSQLSGYNRKYEIILVPSTIALKDAFLKKYCIPIAPIIDAISTKGLLFFLYKGLLYFLNVQKYDLDTVTNNKRSLLSQIKLNIIEGGADLMSSDELYTGDCNRLRSCVKRNSRDITIRWLKLGCGSCSLYEPSGISRIKGNPNVSEE
eukprot:57808_1